MQEYYTDYKAKPTIYQWIFWCQTLSSLCKIWGISNIHFKTIQGISGHSDVFTLMNRYAHPQEDKVIELSNEIATILTQNVENHQMPSRIINQGTEHGQKS